jgi:cystathionine gamma-lyase
VSNRFGKGRQLIRRGKTHTSLLLLLLSSQLRVFALAESLGAVESLAECPSLMTHASVPAEQRALLGIDDTLIRLSVGVESCGDLIADVQEALEMVTKSLQ